MSRSGPRAASTYRAARRNAVLRTPPKGVWRGAPSKYRPYVAGEPRTKHGGNFVPRTLLAPTSDLLALFASLMAAFRPIMRSAKRGG